MFCVIVTVQLKVREIAAVLVFSDTPDLFAGDYLDQVCSVIQRTESPDPANQQTVKQG